MHFIIPRYIHLETLYLTMLLIRPSLQSFYGRHHELVGCYEASISQMTMVLFAFMQMIFFPLSPTNLLADLTEQQCKFLIRNGNCLPLFWWDLCCSSLFSVLCFFVVYVFVRCLWVVHYLCNADVTRHMLNFLFYLFFPLSFFPRLCLLNCSITRIFNFHKQTSCICNDR